MKSPIKAVPAGGRLNLFFVEMIIVLMFFSIASAVILNAFAASGRLSRESGRLERMSFCAQSAAEIFSETGSLSETAEKLFGAEIGSEFPYTEEHIMIEIPLDESCAYSLESSSVRMYMTVSEREYEGLYQLYIKFIDNDSSQLLYEFLSGAYIPEKEGVEN